MFDQVSWQEFERIVGELFEMHDYDVRVSEVIVKNSARRQFDVVAEKYGTTLLADCKKWDKNRYKKTALKKAVGDQLERAEYYPASKRAPLLVTWFDEDVVFHEGVPVVPVTRLNDFLLRINELDVRTV